MTEIMIGANLRIQQCMKCRHSDDFIECKHYEKTGTKCEYYEFPINNSKWSFIRLFSFKGRIGRAEMWLSYLGVFYWCNIGKHLLCRKCHFYFSDIISV